MNWDDCFDARPSKNIRGEDVFDIFRKNTEDMVYSDIPIISIDKIKAQMVSIIDVVAQEELDALLSSLSSLSSDDPEIIS